MNRRSIYILALTAAVIITSLSPFLDDDGRSLSADTASGERWINPFIDKIEQKDIVPEGYIGIWNENDLLKIGTNDTYDKDPSLTWSLDAQYIQMANIDLDGKDLNGGIPVHMKLSFDSGDLTVTLTVRTTENSEEPIEDAEVWLEGVKYETDSDGSVSFPYDNNKESAIMCGGYIVTEPFAIAYTIPKDQTETVEKSFSSNGNIDPIGFNSASGFAGTYDGNGYKIKGADIAVLSDVGIEVNAHTSVGLFSSLDSISSLTEDRVWIENLGVEGGSALVINSTDYGYDNIGGIVGRMGPNTIVYNCYNKNTLYSTAKNNFIGGIVGGIYDPTANTYGLTTASFNKGNITAYASEYGHGTIRAGGIVGSLHGALQKTYNEGDIRCVNLSSETSSINIGGIAGYNFMAVMRYCQNSGELSALTTGVNTIMGGMAGASTTIENCFNEGSMKIESQRSESLSEIISVGGIVGSGSSLRNTFNLGSIDVEYNHGDNKKVHIGGIAGDILNRTTSKIDSSYFLENEIILNGDEHKGQDGESNPILGNVPDDPIYYTIDGNLEPEPTEEQATGPRDLNAFRDQSTFYLGKDGVSGETRGYVFIGDSDTPIWGMFPWVTDGLPYIIGLASIDISASPSDVTANVSDMASFSISAGSAWPMQYQWQVSADGGTTWTNIAGADGNQYDVATDTMALDGNMYRCIVYNERGAIASEAALLTILTDLGSIITGGAMFSVNLWFLYVIMLITFISAVTLWYKHKDDGEE